MGSRWTLKVWDKGKISWVVHHERWKSLPCPVSHVSVDQEVTNETRVNLTDLIGDTSYRRLLDGQTCCTPSDMLSCL